MLGNNSGRGSVNFIKPIGEGFLYQRQHYQNTVKQNIYQAGWLDIEHLDAIRVAIKKDPALKNRVRVFPGYCEEKTITIMTEEVVKELTKNDPREELLPEASTLKEKEVIKWRNAEERRRNERSQKLNAKARKILNDSGIDKKTIFTLFLAACRQEEALWPGQQFAKRIMEAEQWVIPIRLNQNHFTTLVIQFSSGSYTINYFDSLKEHKENESNIIPENILALVEGFEQYITRLGYQYKRKSFVDYSQRVQNDAENCGVFAFYASLYFVYQNVNRKHPEGLFNTWVGVRDFIRNQEARVLALREKMANLLKEEGYQTEFVNDLDLDDEEKESSHSDNDAEVLSWSAMVLLSLGLFALLAAIPLWWGVSLPLELTQLIAMGQQAMVWMASHLPTNPALTFFVGAFSLTFITHFASFIADWMQGAPVPPPTPMPTTQATKESDIQLEKSPPTLLPGFDASREKEREKEEEIDPPCGSPLHSPIRKSPLRTP